MSRIQLCRDTAANWSGSSKVLLSGEIGVETDTSKFKIGNGSSIWSALAYQGTSVDLSNYLLKTALNSSASASGATGSVTMSTGNATGTSAQAASSGDVNITTGSGTQGAGDINIEASGAAEAPGDVSVKAGDSTAVEEKGGDISITAGSAAGGFDGPGGDINLVPGIGGGTNIDGIVSVPAPTKDASAVNRLFLTSGSFTLDGGTASTI